MTLPGLGQELRGTCKGLLRVPLSCGLRDGQARKPGRLRRGGDSVEYESA